MAELALQTIIEMIRAQPSGGTVQERRDGMEALTAHAPVPDGMTAAPVDAGGVPAEWVAMPDADPERVLLYVHGGAHVSGSLNTHRRVAALLSEASGMRVLNVDYRLAPENPHPAAVDDAVSAYRWLLAQGVLPSRIALAGDSAGGGLAAATLVALRDQGAPLPGGAALISPWTDLTITAESYKTRADADPMLDADRLRESAAMYLGGADAATPLASPVHADLTGLPPLLVHVGDAEVLLDDSVTLAERASAAGVDVTLEVWPEMIHVWHAFAGLFPEAQQGIDRVGEWLRERVA
jgi:acetyl esterase/lipase